MPTIGPHFPSSTIEKRKRSEDEDGDDSDTSSPGLSPFLSSNSDTRKAATPGMKKTRTIGPQLPPSFSTMSETAPASYEAPTPPSVALNNDLPEIPNPAHESDSGPEEDDDDFGPSLPPPPSKTTSASDHPTHSSPSTTSPSDPNPSAAAPTRDAWMLVPPTGADWSSSSHVDPTKLKNRRFNTSKSAKGPNPSTQGANTPSIWHETPAEKAARLQREVLGISPAPPPLPPAGQQQRNSSATTTATGPPSAPPLPQQRGPALYDARSSSSAKNRTSRAGVTGQKGKEGEEEEREDDPSARAFDREKDMSLGLKISSSQRREILHKSREGIQSRFAAGGGAGGGGPRYL